MERSPSKLDKMDTEKVTVPARILSGDQDRFARAVLVGGLDHILGMVDSRMGRASLNWPRFGRWRSNLSKSP